MQYNIISVRERKTFLTTYNKERGGLNMDMLTRRVLTAAITGILTVIVEALFEAAE